MTELGEGPERENTMKAFFSFSDDDGILFHDTADEAKAAALAHIEHYREEAEHDGEWPGEVKGVRWGQVLGAASCKALATEPESFDYELSDVQPNTMYTAPPAE